MAGFQVAARLRAKKGLKTKAIENAPLLRPDLLNIWNGFLELAGRRQSGFGPCPISVSDITAWLDLNEVRSHERRRRYFSLICAMDNHWLKVMAEKQSKPK